MKVSNLNLIVEDSLSLARKRERQRVFHRRAAEGQLKNGAAPEFMQINPTEKVKQRPEMVSAGGQLCTETMHLPSAEASVHDDTLPSYVGARLGGQQQNYTLQLTGVSHAA